MHFKAVRNYFMDGSSFEFFLSSSILKAWQKRVLDLLGLGSRINQYGSGSTSRFLVLVTHIPMFFQGKLNLSGRETEPQVG